MPLAWLATPLCFAFELLISESIFLLRQQRKDRFAVRLPLALLIYGAAAVCTNGLFSLIPRTIPVDIIFFLLFFLGSVAVIGACFALPLSQVFFVATAGYSVEHIADSVVKIFMARADLSGMPYAATILLLLIVPYAVCAALFYLLLVRGARLDEKLQYSDKRVLIVSGVNLMICLVLSVVTDHMALSAGAIITSKVYAMLGCMLCLLTQVGLFKDGKMAQTNRTLQQMILIERNQHRLSKEAIDFINIKCHDLKHQIDKLSSMSDDSRKKSVEQLSEAIMIYDSIIKTGNDALDVVLMEKKLLCEKYHIEFSYVVDGKALALMDELDVYSLFGNMLDNAIESLQQEPDEEKRIITLRVYSRMKMLYIDMDNYCGTPVVYKDGEIQTTKAHEPGMHGYGIKSIAYIVSSYGGDLLISTENHHFVLQIMIPENTAA